MQATVQTRIEKLADRSWEIGDTIPAEILETLTERARTALLNARIITLDDGSNQSPIDFGDRLSLIEQTLASISERLSELKAGDDKVTEIQEAVSTLQTTVDDLTQKVDAMALGKNTKGGK